MSSATLPSRKPTLRAPKRPRRRQATVSRSRNRPRGRHGFAAVHRLLKLLSGLVLVAALALALNWVFQVMRKPSELLFPVSGTWVKTPAETWQSYAPLFQKYSTRTLSAAFLAALAQTEAAGDPVARTYWRWSFGTKPFELYRPASTSVGMYQMTDGTFAEARQLCIRDHRVVDPCVSLTGYLRILPGDAIELTAALLDRRVAATLARHGIGAATPSQKQHLAATIHLCGAGAADLYARNGFRFTAGQRCGDHDPRAYLARVDALTGQFKRLAAARYGE